MSAAAASSHWGDWVKARARHVGFLRQQDLARAVGCRPEQLSRWLQHKRPPTRMLKGFDEALARALMTSRGTLFGQWFEQAPEAWDVIATPANEPVPWEAGSPGPTELRLMLTGYVYNLPLAGLRELHAFAKQLGERYPVPADRLYGADREERLAEGRAARG